MTTQRLIAYSFLACLLGPAGCNRPLSEGKPVLPVDIDNAAAAAKPAASPDEVKRQLDEAIRFTFDRRLDVSQQAAWQVLHGCLAYHQDFLVRHEGKDVRAVEYLLSGGKLRGWDFEPGVMFGDRRGLRAITDPGTKSGQGHEDQWLGYLSDCQLPLDAKLTLGGQTYTVADYLAQVEHDIPRNVKQEYSWTLMGISQYRPYDYKWQGSDGNEWSIEKLVEIELGHDLADSPCGGTHRMVGLTLAYNRFREKKGELKGVWRQLHDRIEECVAKAKEYQNPDGSLSSNYFQRPGTSADLADAMGSAGHTLEFLTIALDGERIREPWVERAALAMAKIFRKTRHVDVECGALYHAVHGLRLYRERLFGPMSFAAETKPVDEPAVESTTKS